MALMFKNVLNIKLCNSCMKYTRECRRLNLKLECFVGGVGMGGLNLLPQHGRDPRYTSCHPFATPEKKFYIIPWYGACIKLVLNRAEIGNLTANLENALMSCDSWILRYMPGISWRDRLSKEEVPWRCGARELSSLPKAERLWWFNYVRRRGDGPLARVVNISVEGHHPPRRPKNIVKL